MIASGSLLIYPALTPWGNSPPVCAPEDHSWLILPTLRKAVGLQEHRILQSKHSEMQSSKSWHAHIIETCSLVCTTGFKAQSSMSNTNSRQLPDRQLLQQQVHKQIHSMISTQHSIWGSSVMQESPARCRRSQRAPYLCLTHHATGQPRAHTPTICTYLRRVRNYFGLEAPCVGCRQQIRYIPCRLANPVSDKLLCVQLSRSQGRQRSRRLCLHHSADAFACLLLQLLLRAFHHC